MNRREALGQTMRLAGVAALWASLPARTWAALAAPAGWSAGEERILDLIGDTLLPATPDSPGAAAVGIGRFIAVMATECYPPGAAAAVRRSVEEIEAASRARFGRGLGELSAGEREALVIDYEGRSPAGAKGTPSPLRLIKELTVLGYFTSEPGATKALRYDPVPGTYRGSVPLAPTDRAWAE